MSFEDSTTGAYDVGEIGLFSGTTLFAIGSHLTDHLFSKQTNVPIIVAIGVIFDTSLTLTNVTFPESLITNQDVDAADIVSGTIAVARLPAITASRVPNLPASRTNSGSFDFARMPLNVRRIRSGTADPVDSTGVDGDLLLEAGVEMARVTVTFPSSAHFSSSVLVGWSLSNGSFLSLGSSLASNGNEMFLRIISIRTSQFPLADRGRVVLQIAPSQNRES